MNVLLEQKMTINMNHFSSALKKMVKEEAETW